MSNLAERRAQIVKDHMALECVGDWDAVIATFEHPRYELYGSGRVFDGEEAVRGYFAASRIGNRPVVPGADGGAERPQSTLSI